VNSDFTLSELISAGSSTEASLDDEETKCKLAVYRCEAGSMSLDVRGRSADRHRRAESMARLGRSAVEGL